MAVIGPVDWPSFAAVFHTDGGRTWATGQPAPDPGASSCRYAVVNLRAGRLIARSVVTVSAPEPGPAVATAMRGQVFDRLEDVARRRRAPEAVASPPPVAGRHVVDIDKYSGGGLYELEERTTFRVAERESRAILLTFEGESSATFFGGGGTWNDRSFGGVWKVELDADGEHVWVIDDRARRVAIPRTAAHVADLAARGGRPCPRCAGTETRRRPDGGGRCGPCGLEWSDA